jgi:hypothetical protein
MRRGTSEEVVRFVQYESITDISVLLGHTVYRCYARLNAETPLYVVIKVLSVCTQHEYFNY